VRIEGQDPVMADPGAFHCLERAWSGSRVVTLRLPMRAKTERRYRHSVSIERGPLVYSLRMGEDWRLVGGKPPHGDWEVYPTTAWNYGLQIDTHPLEGSISFETRPVGDCPFSPEGAPVVARVIGRRIPGWILEHNAAGPVPKSPASSSEPLEELVRIPYGCTSLRVTEFPTLG